MDQSKQIIEEAINAREKLDRLIEIANSQNMCNVSDFIDSLSETDAKLILRMIVCGAWEEFGK